MWGVGREIVLVWSIGLLPHWGFNTIIFGLYDLKTLTKKINNTSMFKVLNTSILQNIAFLK
jgi:hypothetical protein